VVDPAPSRGPELVAGFGEPPRHRFEERCEAEAAIGSTSMRTVLDGTGLRLGEIEFRTDRPADRALLDAARG
jgi:hypothetical protein